MHTQTHFLHPCNCVSAPIMAYHKAYDNIQSLSTHFNFLCSGKHMGPVNHTCLLNIPPSLYVSLLLSITLIFTHTNTGPQALLVLFYLFILAEQDS